MKYYADCEFDGFGGPLLSLALIREDNEAIYIIYEHNVLGANDPWVTENIIHILDDIPSPIPGMAYSVDSNESATALLGAYLRHDDNPHIIVDWPDDIKYICQALITGPGTMINIPRVTFEVVRVDSWPNKIPCAVQHNAYWDAQALRVKLNGT